MTSGWALLGEVRTKWIPVSTMRFSSLRDDTIAGRLEATVRGPAGEVVSVSGKQALSIIYMTVTMQTPLFDTHYAYTYIL
jgi:hypothetical protein